jgi:hypothetical protein
MSSFLKEAERYQNYEFVAYMYDKFFKEDCFDFTFDAKNDIEIIRFIIEEMETNDHGISENFMLDYEDHFFNSADASATQLEDDSSTKVKFFNCLRENVFVGYY